MSMIEPAPCASKLSFVVLQCSGQGECNCGKCDCNVDSAGRQFWGRHCQCSNKARAIDQCGGEMHGIPHCSEAGRTTCHCQATTQLSNMLIIIRNRKSKTELDS